MPSPVLAGPARGFLAAPPLGSLPSGPEDPPELCRWAHTELPTQLQIFRAANGGFLDFKTGMLWFFRFKPTAPSMTWTGDDNLNRLMPFEDNILSPINIVHINNYNYINLFTTFLWSLPQHRSHLTWSRTLLHPLVPRCSTAAHTQATW